MKLENRRNYYKVEKKTRVDASGAVRRQFAGKGYGRGDFCSDGNTLHLGRGISCTWIYTYWNALIAHSRSVNFIVYKSYLKGEKKESWTKYYALAEAFGDLWNVLKNYDGWGDGYMRQ